MTVVIGRDGPAAAGPTASIGQYRALDGSSGAPVELDLDRPHAALIVGKRGYGKSYTLGVLAEELARTDGVAPVVLDPMGVFASLASGGSASMDRRAIEATVVDVSGLDAAPATPSSAGSRRGSTARGSTGRSTGCRGC